MSKFCANCGAQADDAAAVCGNCGTPFGAAPAVSAASGNAKFNVKKIITAAVALIVAAVIVIVGINVISSFTGARGAARKFCNAEKKGKTTAIAKLLSIRYGEDLEEREEYAENRFAIDDDDDESDKYKISYSVKEAKKVSSSELKAIKNYIEDHTEEEKSYVKAAKKVKITVTTKEKKTGDGGRYTTWVVFTKEKGKWKYFGTYDEVKSLSKNKSSGYTNSYDDDDYSDYYDDYYDDDDYDW